MLRAWRRVWACVCGGAPSLYEFTFPVPEFAARCDDCARPGPMRPSKEQALAAWNQEMQLLEQGVRNEERASKEPGRLVH